MNNFELEKDKQSLIELVEWYRDRSSASKEAMIFYNELINDIKSCRDYSKLELFNKIIDGWLDY